MVTAQKGRKAERHRKIDAQPLPPYLSNPSDPPPMLRVPLAPLLLTLLLAWNGCVRSSSTASLDGTEWTLQRIETPKGPITPEAEPPTLQFEDGRIAGSDGCNQFSGSVQKAEDGSLTVSQLASTKRACPPPFNELSDAVLGVLNGHTVATEVMGDELRLTAAGTVLIYARRSPP